jgi:hypothetical protein
MLITGTFAGFLSGLIVPAILGLRGAGFGFCLTLTVVLIQRSGWKQIVAYLPAIILGILLAVSPFELDLGGKPPKTYDYITLFNTGLFIPLLTFAYLKESKKKRIGLLLLFGLLSSLLRSWSFDSGWRAAALVLYNFPFGMLPFLFLWLAAMRLTDPRFIREPSESRKEDVP